MKANITNKGLIGIAFERQLTKQINVTNKSLMLKITHFYTHMRALIHPQFSTHLSLSLSPFKLPWDTVVWPSIHPTATTYHGTGHVNNETHPLNISVSLKAVDFKARSLEARGRQEVGGLKPQLPVSWNEEGWWKLLWVSFRHWEYQYNQKKNTLITFKGRRAGYMF